MAKSYVLQYNILTAADGTTPAPAYDTVQPVGGRRTYEVLNLGLIDLSLGGIIPANLQANPSTMGQRYVAWAWAKGFSLSSVSPIRTANDVEGAGYVDLEDLEIIPLASNQFYSRKGYIMPHGTVLKVQDMVPAVPGTPIVLRLGIILPETPEEDSVMRESYCCTDGLLTIAA